MPKLYTLKTRVEILILLEIFVVRLGTTKIGQLKARRRNSLDLPPSTKK